MLQYFDNIAPGAKNFLTFNFAAGLTAGNLLSGTPTVSVTVLSGTDPNPAAILNGAPMIDSTSKLVLVPVAPAVDNVTYLLNVVCPTVNTDIVLPISWGLPVYSAPSGVVPNSGTESSYNDANFRMQFPAFADNAAYPVTSLQFAWDMATNWVSQCSRSFFGLRPRQLQQANDLMAAVIVYQLYGPNQSASQQGTSPGAITSASEGSVSASFQIPAVGNAGFNSMLLASPPYGRMLLALLQIGASVGPYIRGRPSYIPP